MAFNAARQSFPLTLASSTVLAALVSVRHAVSPYAVETPYTDGMPIAEWLTCWSVEHPVWSGIAVALLAIWTVLIITSLGMRFTSSSSRNYLPIPLFIIIACGIYLSHETLASQLAAWLFAQATSQFMLTFRKDYCFEEAFKGGFYLGVIPLLYAPALILWVLVPFLATLYRRSVREFVVCVAGVVLPTLGAWFIGWVMGDGVWHLFREWWRCVAHHSANAWPTEVSIMAIICVVFVVTLTAMALGWFLWRRKTVRARQRKMISHVVVATLLLTLSFALPGASISGMPLLGVGLSMLIPSAFISRQSSVASLLYLLLVAAVLSINIIALF
jgi:hypothetical protein